MANNQLHTALTIRANVEGTNQVNALATSLDNVNHELTQSTRPTNGASQALDNLGNQAGQSAHQTNQLTQAIHQVNSGLQSTTTPATNASNAINNLGNQMTQSATAMQSMTSGLAGLMGALGVGIGVQEIVQLSDEFNNLESRVRLATESGGDFNHAMASIREIADHTTMPLTATGDLFTKLTQATRELGYSQSEVIGLTKTISEAMAVSGGDMASMEAGLTQLAQGLSAGALRGDEFNSVVEQAPRLAQAMADGLGVTIGKLREMAGEGKLTAEVVGNALKSQADKIAYEYSQMPNTVSGSLTVLKNSLIGFIGELDNELSGSNGLATFIMNIADSIENIDPSVIEGLKNALANVGEVAKVLLDSVTAIPNALGDVVGAMMGLEAGTGQVSLLQGLMNGLALTTGAVADGFKALQIVIYGAIAGVQTGIAKVATAMYELTGVGGEFAKSMSESAKEATANFENLVGNFESSLGKAMDGIGKTTEDKLKEIADQARAKYDDMAKSGQASATALENAFKDYAQKAIQANGGVVDEILKQELAQKNLQAVVDETGKVIISSMNQAKQAVESVDLSKHAESFKALGIDVGEFAGGLSSKANTALTAFNDLAKVAGDNTAQLAMAYNGAKQAMGNNAQGLTALNDALHQATNGNKELAQSIKDTAQAQLDAKNATDEQAKALDALGVSMSAINAGMSQNGQKMADNLKVGLSVIKDTAKGADELKTALNQALDTALASAQTQADFKAIQEQIANAGLTAQVSAENMAKLNNGINGNSQAVEDNTQKVEQNTQAKTNNAKASETVAQAQTTEAQAIAKTTQAISIQTAGLNDLGLSTEKITQIQQGYWDMLKGKMGGTYTTAFMGMLAMQKQEREAMQKLNSELEIMGQKLGQASVEAKTLTEAQQLLQKASNATMAGIKAIDDVRLSKLREQIAQTEQKMSGLVDTARQTAEALQSELASLNGDEAEVMRLKHTQKLADLESKLAEAKSRNNADEIKHYENALKLQRQINDIESKKAQENATNNPTLPNPSMGNVKTNNSKGADDVIKAWQQSLYETEQRAKAQARAEIVDELIQGAKTRAR